MSNKGIKGSLYENNEVCFDKNMYFIKTFMYMCMFI